MKYLGVDFGLRRIGLATSDGILATPYKVITVKSLKDAIFKLAEVVREGEFDQVVIGMPEGKMGQTVLGLINKLRKSGIDVLEVDETLSTKNAIQRMIELNIPKKKRRVNDAYSASIILQNYLDKDLLHTSV